MGRIFVGDENVRALSSEPARDGNPAAEPAQAHDGDALVFEVGHCGTYLIGCPHSGHRPADARRSYPQRSHRPRLRRICAGVRLNAIQIMTLPASAKATGRAQRRTGEVHGAVGTVRSSKSVARTKNVETTNAIAQPNAPTIHHRRDIVQAPRTESRSCFISITAPSTHFSQSGPYLAAIFASLCA